MEHGIKGTGQTQTSQSRQPGGVAPGRTAATASLVQRRPVQRRVESSAAAVAADATPGDTGTTGPGDLTADSGGLDGTPDATSDPAACPDAAEQAQKEAFRVRTDLAVIDNIPSPGTGKFDARYFPMLGLMPVTVKIYFDFVQADDTPDLAGLVGRALSGQSINQFFWSESEKTDFKSQFVTRCFTRWSARHTLRSIKPCWTEFSATPIVTPIPHDDQGTAHYSITVHKSSGPGIDYKSGLSRVQLSDPTAQPTGNLWQSDVQESGNFRSGGVARDERRRIEAALASAAATPINFAKDADVVPSADVTKLTTFAAALNQANPSAPLIPIDVKGFASSDGDPAHNQDLSERRANNVAAVLTGASVRQPIRPSGEGPVGAPDDAASRRVDIEVDHTFETTYSSNRYSVGEHEFGHMLGNLDEYQNQTTGATGARQTQYSALITSAGLNHPTWGDDSSSVMSAGVDVLPRHYVTLWEALGRMTDPDITQAQWSFES